MNRQLTAGFLWTAALLAALYGYSKHQRASAFELPIPQQGDTLDVAAVMAAFGVRLDEKAGAWVLVVTSDCPACLSLDTELVHLRAVADCHGRNLVPLIIELDSSSDSIRSVLGKHGIAAAGIADRTGFSATGVWAVPTLLGVSGNGTIESVLNPAHGKQWLSRLRCKSGP